MLVFLLFVAKVLAKSIECVDVNELGDCTQCVEGWVLADSLCFHGFCPTGYVLNGQCEKKLPDLTFASFFSKQTRFLQKNTVQTIDRGLYFTRDSSLQVNFEQTIAPVFTINLFIKLQNHGKIFAFSEKKKFSLEYDQKKIALNGKKFSEKLGKISENWENLTIQIRLNEEFAVIISVLSGVFSTVRIKTGPFLDREMMNSVWFFEGFIGFLYSFSVVNSVELYFVNYDLPDCEILFCGEEICLSCLEHTRRLDTCNYGYYWDSVLSLCVKCNAACLDCTGGTAAGCINCAGSYAKIQGICMLKCPLGFENNLNICVDMSASTNGVVYDLNFTMLNNNIADNAGISSSSIIATAGSSSTFYPTYDSADPYAVKERGFYFTGSSYIKNTGTLVIYGPVFTIGTWLKPILGTGYITAKQTSSLTYLSLSLNNFFPVLSLYFSSLESYTSSYSLTATSWNFLFVSVTLSNFKSIVSMTINTSTSASITLSTYYTDVFSNFFNTFGAQYLASTYTSFYTGFMWSYTLRNNIALLTDFIQTSGCLSCPICPLNNSNNCLSTCTLFQYIDSDSNCKDCTSSCQTYGCVRNDIKCNLCYNQKCSICSSFKTGCSLCVDHAYLDPMNECLCNYNYVWSSILDECVPCSDKCSVCDGGGYLGCSVCISGYYMIWGVCVSACPTGYVSSSGNCILSGGSMVMNLLLDKIEGVVYDSIAGIPAVTGSTESFYPYYDENDPIASIGRGYYFDEALMHFAPYLTYTAPYLTFAPVCYIGLWINPTSPTGIIFSDVDPDYNIILQVELLDSYPVLTLYLTSSTNTASPSRPSHTCENQILQNQWNYIAFSIELSNAEITSVTCYINTISDNNPTEVGQGHFTDTTLENFMLIGTSQTSSTATSNNSYKGFFYNILVDTDITQVDSQVSTTCNGSCIICFTNGNCLENCAIDEYPTGDTLTPCGNCHLNCKDVGCRNDNSTCNICEDPTCLICTDFVGNCISYNCESGFFKLEGMADCEACDVSCKECKDSGPVACTSCETDFLLNGACHPFCPSGYVQGANVCTLTLSEIVSLDLGGIKGIVTDSQLGFSSIAGSSLDFYPDFDGNDPWPIKDRGYYFHADSYLNFPPNSLNTQHLTFGNQFTITAWISPISSGTLFSKTGFSATTYMSLDLATVLTFKLNFSTLSTTNSISSIPSNWTYIGVSIKLTSSNTTSLQFFINTNTESPITLSPGYYLDLQTDFDITIGALKTTTGYSFSWVGLLYKFKIFSQNIVPLDVNSNCDQTEFTCNYCPSSKICLNSCLHQYWWDGNSCKKCEECTYESCVRQDKTCNLCMDFICLECDTFGEGCLNCKENAGLDNGICKCNTHFYWDDVLESCEYCDPSEMATLQGACLSGCPTGYINNAGVCEGTPGKIFLLELDKVIIGEVTDSVSGIKVRTGNSNSFYPEYDINDPYAGKDRGYYFNGVSSYMDLSTADNNQDQLVISPAFAISIWLYPISQGTIFTKQSDSTFSILLRVTPDFFFESSIVLDNLTVALKSSTSITLHSWNFIGITISVLSNSNSQGTLTFNTLISSPTFLSSRPFADLQSDFTCTIGASYNTLFILNNYFTGYLFSLTIYNTDQSLISTISLSCTGDCLFCPISTLCITNCNLSQFYFAATCTSCSNSCTKGCVRNNDCNLCSDRLCYNCKDYTSTGCLQCVDGASMVNGICVCNSGSTMVRENGNFYCENQCMSFCKTCYSMSNGDCISCNDGYYFMKGLCLPYCQIGYLEGQGVCASYQNDMMVVHYVFDKLVNNQPDLVNKLLAFMGSTENYTYEYDANDPIPVYQRGIYFEGTKYVVLPQNSIENSEIFLGNSHSIKLWIRPTMKSATSCILTKESTTQSLYLSISPTTLKPTVTYQLSNTKDLNLSYISASNSAVSLDSWQELIITFKRTMTNSVVTLYLNGISGEIIGQVNTFFLESASAKFILGHSDLQSASYQGFIYELRIYNYVLVPSSPQVCPCGTCTESGDCLSNCPFLTRAPECLYCLDSCINGCTNDINCSLNFDLLCETATGFLASSCTKCVPQATFTTTGCECVTNSIASNTFCTCFEGDEGYLNECVTCFYHIQQGDIESYFSPDYLSIVFDFAFALQSTTSSACEILFEGKSFEKIGKVPECVWDKNFKSLKVSLGLNASVLNETVWFNPNTLLTNILTCGSNRGPIDASIEFKYEFPVILPLAIIVAPLDYYIYCGDLFIIGKQSTGGYGRDLIYQWNIESTPYVPVLDQYNYFSNYSEITFSNSTLTPTSAFVNLTVQNWLGFMSSTSQFVFILAGIGINLQLDANIKWKMTTFMSKSIYVQAASECGLSNSLKYTWKIDSFTGEHSKVDENLLWTSQKVPSKLYIPARSLWPGTYFFLLHVDDLELNLSGRALLVLHISDSALQVNFSPWYITRSISKDLDLNGTIANDPDQIDLPMEYKWTCDNGTDCTYIISNPNAIETIVKKELLFVNATYKFSLMATKGIRNTTGVLMVKIQNSDTVFVKFKPVPAYVNYQENFVIQVEISEECNCTYLWTQVSGAEFEISLDGQGKDLGIMPYSLQEGELYLVQLEVNDTDGKESVYQQYFTADIAPFNGEFEVNPSSGSEITVFSLKANGWIDGRDPAYPLTYQFGYYILENERFLNIRNESSKFYCTLPAGNLIVFVRTFDVFGLYSESIFPVNVSNSNSALNNFLNILEDFQKITWTDPDIYPGYLNLISLHTNTIESLEITLPTISILLSSLLIVDHGKIDVVLQVLKNIISEGLNSTQAETVFESLDELTQVIDENQVIFSNSRGEKYLQVISATDVMNYTLVVENGSLLVQVNEVLKKLMQVVSKNMGQGQYLFFENLDIKCFCMVFSGYSVVNFNTFEFLGDNFALLPSVPDLQVNSSLSTLALFSLYNIKDFNTSEEYSSAVEFSLWKFENNTLTPWNIDFQSTGVNITIPIWNLEKTPNCGYWEGTEWSTSGCYLQELYFEMALCTCSHMSLYTSSSLFGDIKESQFIVVYISSIISLLWLIIGLFLYVKDSKEAESKVFIENIMNAMPAVVHKPMREFKPNLIADNLGKEPEFHNRSVGRKETAYVPIEKIAVVEENPKPMPTLSKTTGFAASDIDNSRPITTESAFVERNLEENRLPALSRPVKRFFTGSKPPQPSEKLEFEEEKKSFIENKAEFQEFKPENEKYHVEGTQLFTETGTERIRFRRNKKDGEVNQEFQNPDDERIVKYSMWIADYYWSAWLFHRIYSRFSRHSQGIMSILVQILLIGVVIKGYSGEYVNSKGKSLNGQAGNLIFQDVAVAISMALISNLAVAPVVCLFFKQEKIIGSENERKTGAKKQKYRRNTGVILIAVTVIGASIGVGVIEMSMQVPSSLLWLCCIFLSFIFDFFIIQPIKALMYKNISESIFFPTN